MHAGDTLVLYGRGEALSELDNRPAGPAGDEAHDLAIARQTDAVERAEEAYRTEAESRVPAP